MVHHNGNIKIYIYINTYIFGFHENDNIGRILL